MAIYNTNAYTLKTFAVVEGQGLQNPTASNKSEKITYRKTENYFQKWLFYNRARFKRTAGKLIFATFLFLFFLHAKKIATTRINVLNLNFGILKILVITSTELWIH